MTTTDIIETQLSKIRPGATDVVLGMTVTRIGLGLWRLDGTLRSGFRTDYLLASYLVSVAYERSTGAPAFDLAGVTASA